MSSLAERHVLEQLPDVDVAARVMNGEPALFELLMRRYNRRLFRIARGILGNDGEAEDAVQDAYISAYFKLQQFRGPDGFSSWLCRIATNEALMRRRKHSRVALTEFSGLDDLADHETSLTQRQSQANDPETTMHNRQLQHLLEHAIDRLPEHYRTVFVLREVEQMSVADTAHCLGIEEGTVKTRAHRARQLLQTKLTGEFAAAITDSFNFDGVRCDRIVSNVIARIS